MPEKKEYIAGTNTFVEGVLVRKDQKFFTERPAAKSWIPTNPEPSDDSEESADSGNQKAGELVKEIAEMTDIAKLTELKSDNRATVSKAAAKRIEALAGPAPGGASGDE